MFNDPLAADGKEKFKLLNVFIISLITEYTHSLFWL